MCVCVCEYKCDRSNSICLCDGIYVHITRNDSKILFYINDVLLCIIRMLLYPNLR